MKLLLLLAVLAIILMPSLAERGERKFLHHMRPKRQDDPFNPQPDPPVGHPEK